MTIQRCLLLKRVFFRNWFHKHMWAAGCLACRGPLLLQSVSMELRQEISRRLGRGEHEWCTREWFALSLLWRNVGPNVGLASLLSPIQCSWQCRPLWKMSCRKQQTQAGPSIACRVKRNEEHFRPSPISMCGGLQQLLWTSTFAGWVGVPFFL